MFPGGGSPRNPPPISGATNSILNALSELTSTAGSASYSASSHSPSTFTNVTDQYSLTPNSESPIIDQSNLPITNIQTEANPFVNMSSTVTDSDANLPIIVSASGSEHVDTVNPLDQPVSSNNTTTGSIDDVSQISVPKESLLQGGLSSSSSTSIKPRLLNRSNDIQKPVPLKTEITSEADGSTNSIINKGVQYFVGDYVYVKPPISPSNKKPMRQIVNIERTWVTSEGEQMVRCVNYFRPMETSHKPTRKFFKKEVFQTDGSTIYQLSDIIGKCYVLGANDYFTKTLEGPEPIAEKDVYVCEYRYSDKYRYFKKISAGSLSLSEQVKLIDRSVPLEMIRVDGPETLTDNEEESGIKANCPPKELSENQDQTISIQLPITPDSTGFTPNRTIGSQLLPTDAIEFEDPLCLPDPEVYLTNNPKLSSKIIPDMNKKLRPGRPRKILQNVVEKDQVEESKASPKNHNNPEKSSSLRKYRPPGLEELELRVKLKRIDGSEENNKEKAVEGITASSDNGSEKVAKKLCKISEIITTVSDDDENDNSLDKEMTESSKKRKHSESESKKDGGEDSFSEQNYSEESDLESDGDRDSDEELGSRKSKRRMTRRTRSINQKYRCAQCGATFDDQAQLEEHHWKYHLEEDDEWEKSSLPQTWRGKEEDEKDENWFEGRGKRKKFIRFTQESLHALLNSLLIHQEELHETRGLAEKKDLFLTIAKELKDLQDGELSGKRCMDKWNNLYYQQKMYYRNRNGGAKKPEFFDEIEQILKKIPSSKQIAKNVHPSQDDEDLPSLANSAQAKVPKSKNSEIDRLMRAASPTILSDSPSPMFSPPNSPSRSASTSPQPEFTPVTIVTTETPGDISKESSSKESLTLPPEPQFSPPVTELIDETDHDNINDAITSSSISLPPAPQFSPPVTIERAQRDPLQSSEGTLRPVPLSSLTAPLESSGETGSNNTNSLPQPPSMIPSQLLTASMLASQLAVSLPHAVSPSHTPHSHPDNTIVAGQASMSQSGTTVLITPSGLPSQARIDGTVNNMVPQMIPGNSRINLSRQPAGKPSAASSNKGRDQARNVQISEPRPKTSLETISESVAGIFDMCKQQLELYKEEIELRRRSTKAQERQAKIQEQRLKEERRHRSRFVALMENHGRNHNKEKGSENGEV